MGHLDKRLLQMRNTLLITHDSWSHSKIFTPKIKLLPNPYISRMEIRKLWSNESNALTMGFELENLQLFYFSDFYNIEY